MHDPLTRRLLCGDRDGMGRLFVRLGPRLNAVARRIVGDSDAPDVVQRAFEKILLHCDQFRGGSRVSTWMHRIVVKEALSWLRQTRSSGTRGIEASNAQLALAVPDDPEEGALRREAHERLMRGLERLSDSDRTLLTATAPDGRSLATVRYELGISLGAVKSRAFRARRWISRGFTET